MPNFRVVRGEESNLICADLGFVQSQNFDSFELEEEPTPEPMSEEQLLLVPSWAGRQWRNEELKNTDWIVAITDHPARDSYITYRAALRAWPSDTENFPDTKPTL